MPRVKVYSTATCLMCGQTKMLLEKWRIGYDEVRVDLDRAALREMQQITDHARTVPQITIDGTWIGGFHELTELHMQGELAHLMDV